MDNKALSPESQTILVNSFHEYIMSEATKSLQPTLWLSVIDVCNRIKEIHPKLHQVLGHAHEQFEAGFNQEVLRTDYSQADHAPG